jgi:hypothetical protein
MGCGRLGHSPETHVSWPEAFTTVGIAWAIAFAIWAFFKYGFSFKD